MVQRGAALLTLRCRESARGVLGRGRLGHDQCDGLHRLAQALLICMRRRRSLSLCASHVHRCGRMRSSPHTPSERAEEVTESGSTGGMESVHVLTRQDAAFDSRV